MKKINVGVVGLGYWGPNLVRNFYKHEGFEIKWGCDLLDRNLLKIKKDYPFLNLTKNINDLLTDNELDLIAIATPPETHFRLGNLVLENRKHLWVEKPFTTSYNDALKLFKLAKKKNLYLHVDLPYIFYPPVEKIKEIIDKGEIGKPFYYTSWRTNLGLVQKEVDVVWDLAPHDLSIIFYLFPKLDVEKVRILGSSHLKNHSKNQIANLVINFNNGFAAYIYLSWLSPVKIRLVTIGGSEKMILFDDINPTEKIKIYNKNIQIIKDKITPFNPVYREGDVIVPYFLNEEALFRELNFILNEFKNKKRSYLTSNIALRFLEVLSFQLV